MVTVDGRCHCERCRSRTEDIYRMIGTCLNCGATPILMLFRAGDNASSQTCPTCGCSYKLAPQRLATPDEIPDAVPPTGPAEMRG